MRRWTIHYRRGGGQHFRCRHCGARSCCAPAAPCSNDVFAPYTHDWVPMGTGKPFIAHLERA